VALGSPRSGIHFPPAGPDAIGIWFEQVSHQLVLLAEFPLSDIERAVATFTGAVEEHARSTDLARPPEGTADSELARVLAADHARFSTSIEQLRWFLAVVQREDHGGHRQALGQYGRIFAEAFLRHRTEENRYFARVPPRGPRARTLSPRSAY